MALPLDKPVGILVKTTCVDYPGRLAGSFFLKSCNIRCPYCYNIGLVLGNEDPSHLSSVQELFDHLEKRKGVLTGLVISGGEPLLNPYTPIIIKKAKELGYNVKLDTNGTLPFELKSILENPLLKPDFVAMDIKSDPLRYSELLCPKSSKFLGNKDYWAKHVKENADIVAALPCDQREYRTVLVPGMVTKEDIKAMAQVLPKDASWQFAQFINKNCLDPTYNEIYPYTDDEAGELVEYARTFIPGAALR